MMTTRGFGVLRPQSTGGPLARATAALTASALGLGLAATVSVAPASAVQSQAAVVTTTAVAPDTYEKRVQRMVNRRRAQHDLRRLRVASCAKEVAQEWSTYLARNDLFVHRSMTEVLDRCDASYAGETLGRGTMSPRKLVRMWMNSPGHRAVLLSRKSRRIGVGATPDASGRWVVAANFIRF